MDRSQDISLLSGQRMRQIARFFSRRHSMRFLISATKRILTGSGLRAEPFAVDEKSCQG